MPIKDNSWVISIVKPFLGFAPAYWENTYPAFGRPAQAGAMQNVDIIDPNKLTQGPGLSNLTNGTQAAAVTTTIKHILENPTADDVTWGVGGSKLYKISSTAVTNSGGYPITINKAAVTGEDGESVVAYNGILYVFYNHSGSAGDIGKLTISSDTFDEDWGSTVPTGAGTLNNAPHPAILGDDGIIYFGNGAAVGQYDPATNTLSATELDLPTGTVVVDLAWNDNVIWIAANYPNLATGNTNQGIIYVWNTVASSWQQPTPKIPGRIGSLFIKNGRVFVFYQDLSSSGGYKLGYVNGNTVIELTGFSGSLPLFYQKCHYKNMITFISSGLIYLWGSTSAQTPIALSQFADGGYATVGALANPFGTPMVASTDGGSNFRLAKLSGYDTACNWKTLMFDVTTSLITKIALHHETTSSGARCDVVLRYNQGVSNKSVGSITHVASQIRKTFYPKVEVDDFRIELDWSNGSATNPLAIRRIDIYGQRIAKE